MKKTLLATLLILLAFSASSFTASLTPVKTEANATSPAVFRIQLDNPSPRNHSYSISLLSPKSSWFYYPRNINVESNSNTTAQLTISPVKNSVQNRYRFDLKIREQATAEIKELTGFFHVSQPYKLHIISLSQDKQSLKPGEVVNTKIKIQNLHNTPVSNYQVIAEYRNRTKTDTGTEILPGGTRIYEFSFRASKNASPTTNQIKYTVKAEGKIRNTANQNITIESIKNITKNQNTTNKLLTVKKTVSVLNTGNSATNTSVTADIPSYLSSITSTTPKPDEIDEVNGVTVYTWETRLKPGEKFSATYTTKYWIPLLGIVILAAGITAIKILGKDIELRKTARKEGEKIKINLEIENNSEKTYEKLEMEEFIPDIATVDEKFSMNTPEVRKTSEGTKLTWNVKELKPGDQRIIQYQIKPKVNVEEKVEFQKAVLKDRDGQKIAESNTTSSEFNTT